MLARRKSRIQSVADELIGSGSKALVLDLFSRMVLGWSMAATQDATLVV